ncbi:MAG: prolyl oligopeptidase family serine peptidase [Gemmatimonadota bacterium]|nr:prolyl oligopeptidase family serine peptidase [Gemmatimonadota bacterium]
MTPSTPLRLIGRTLAAVLLAVAPLSAQNGDAAAQMAADRALLVKEGYQAPPEVIAKLVTAPRHLNIQLSTASPDRRHFLKQESEGLPSVEDFGKPHNYYGGLQVDPKANRARTLTTRGSTGLSLIDAVTGKSTSIEVPKGATVSNPAWSPDGKQLAYIANFDAASHVYVADVATGKSAQVTNAKTPLLATLVTGVDWTADGKSVIVVLIPDGRGPEPKQPAIATGPRVQTWLDPVKSPQRQFASLMSEPWEFDQLKYYATGQLAVIDVKTKVARKVGAPAMIQSVDASPDGQFFRVSTMLEPFSYMVQYTSFGNVEQIWDANGRAVAELQKRPLREMPDSTQAGAGFGGRGGGGIPGKRLLAWMPAGPGMYYVPGDSGANGGGRADGAGAAAGGRGGRGGAPGGARRERVVKWTPPFGAGDTATVYQADGPISALAFTDDGKQLFVATTANSQGEIYHVDLSNPSEKHTVVRQRAWDPTFTAGGGGRGGAGGGGGRGGAQPDDSLRFYANPGAMMLKRGAQGGQVAMVSSDGAVFLTGTQYHPDFLKNAPRSFVDRVDVKTGTKSRIFEGAPDAVEAVTAALDDDFSRAIVSRQSPKEVPDFYLRDMKAGTMTKLTDNKDYTPEFTNAIRKRINVKRADGFSFIVRLTLPADYTAGTRLPAMFWFYPYEYTSQENYDRTLRTENVNTFPSGGPRTIEYLTQLGYAVANFDPPIVGENGRMNDNYVSDLVMNLAAVIDELDKQGYIDRSRLGIGGHSYGAFSTMNALAHTPFFKAGIAGDGMYNRSLTPTAFQSERRDFWEAQKTYQEMSPFFYADKIQGAVLMYHSIEDQNVGTDPISSIRMMQALRANGKVASLYMYPYEDHGPATKESDLDQWARWVAWLDLYVKHANEPKKPTVVP